MNIAAQGTNSNSDIELSGFYEFDHISYFKNEAEKINNRYQNTLQFDISKRTNYVNFIGKLEIRDDMADEQMRRFYQKELYVDLMYKKIDVSIGKKVFSWGTTDNLNPTNNLNPIDYSDYLDSEDERIGVVNLNLKYYMNNMSFEAYFLPIFSSSVLPNQNSRWFSRLPSTIENPLVSGEYINTKYNFNSEILPDQSVTKPSYAFKFNGTIGSMPISVSYVSNYDNIPYYEKNYEFVSEDTIQINLTPFYTKRQIFGADFSKIIGKYGIRGEFAYYLVDEGTRKKHPIINDSYFYGVLGVDREFSNIIGDNNLYINIQWAQQILSDKDSESNDLRHIFKRSIVSKIKYKIGYLGSIALNSVYNFKAKSYYLRPELSYSIVDNLKLLSYVDFLEGPKNSFFGKYNNNSRVQLKLKYSF